MAVKPLARLILLALLIIAAAGTFRVIRSNLRARSAAEQDRFISAYVALSLARERFQGEPDSLAATYNHIFSKFQTDSTWIVSYAGKIAEDIGRSENIWQRMIAKLDSLRRGGDPDSIFLN